MHCALSRRVRAAIESSAPPSAQAAQALTILATQTWSVPFLLDTGSEAGSIWYHNLPIIVPLGLVKAPAMTLDGLALILAHEAAHAHGIACEAHADYWAARHGLPALWRRTRRSARAERRGQLAAYSALRSQFAEPFDPARQDQVIELYATGHPTVQSRWTLFCAGFQGLEMPPIGRREPNSAPVLFSREEAIAFLGLSEGGFRQLLERPAAPVVLRLPGGERYIKDDLERFAEVN